MHVPNISFTFFLSYIFDLRANIQEKNPFYNSSLENIVLYISLDVTLFRRPTKTYSNVKCGSYVTPFYAGHLSVVVCHVDSHYWVQHQQN